MIKALYINKRLFFLLVLTGFVLILGYFFPALFVAGKMLLLLIIALAITDLLLLFVSLQALPEASRQAPDRLSNGDYNTLTLAFIHYYPFPVYAELIDELPPQFQIRDFLIADKIKPALEKHYEYSLRPVKRGVYDFGRLNVFVHTPVGLFRRRFRFPLHEKIPVYPSFLQMRKYELLAASDFLTEAGIKKIRKISHSHEFDQIRNYVKGDEYRLINWKATARRAALMVNQYQDEKSQAVYSLIDMGRNMELPFQGMSLLDYAINATLVISNIAMYKHDKAGMITFNHKVQSFLPADRSSKQMRLFMEKLYNQQTTFPEPNYEMLYAYVRRHIRQRSLLLLFTNFQGITSVRRQLRFLRMLAKKHLLVVVFFRNTGIQEFIENRAGNTREIYEKVIAEQFDYEQKIIVKELEKHSIQALLVPPENLTVETINKYLELKAKGLI